MLALLVLAPARGDAQDGEQERRQAVGLFKKANRLRDAGQFNEAVERYLQAYKLYPSFKIAMNLGLVLEKMERRVEAAQAYSQFLTQGMGEAPAEMVELAKARLKVLKAKLAVVVFRGGRTGATVMINELEVGKLPFKRELFLEPGYYQLEVSFPGFLPHRENRKLSAGKWHRVKVKLVSEVVDLLASSEMGFTPTELEQLAGVGCPLDKGAVAVANRMARRGFTGKDYVRACSEYRAMERSYNQLKVTSHGAIETVAVGQKLGLDRGDLYNLVWYHDQEGVPLTEAYNDHVVGGGRFKLIGWIAGGAGVGLTILGGVLIGMDKEECVMSTSYGCIQYKSTGLTGPGAAVVTLGGLAVIAGGTLVILGYLRDKRRLPGETLEKQPASKLNRASIQLDLVPTVGPGYAGLGLTGRF